jgi:hypothetical protein
MASTMLRGIIPVIPTPFTENEALAQVRHGEEVFDLFWPCVTW